ncbi:MAG: NAD+ synthase [Bacteroidota bacterium]|nr:NAD+ synthase [Bacteroidota bacterium]MDP4214821.1 NAD+ synthase [Bacteroidota bacterium]MDP4247235.1 NAD+ synthase [Bacteroidota bacterium]MDP4253123.1 NAD+ synthase [Bacteroidota bacterium]
MKIVLAQQNYHIGNFEANLARILDGIARAKQAGADLVVFSELCICGYPPRDFLEFEDFIAQCYAGVDRVRQEADTIGVIIGSPQRNPAPEGKALFNAAWLLYEKEIKGIAHKTCLPTYDVFDEYRYFEPGDSWKAIPFKGARIALTICEDIWNLGDNPLYRVCPMDQLITQAPDLMINISASPFDYDHDEDRKEVVRRNVLKYRLPMIYCNAIGSQTEIVFDGGSLVYNAQGELVRELNYFEEDFALVEIDEHATARNRPGVRAGVSAGIGLEISGPVPPLYEEILPGLSVVTQDTPPASAQAPAQAPAPELDKEMRVSRVRDPGKAMEYLVAENNIRQIHDALVLGVRDYFYKMGFVKAILGSSGGIDSAVTLALACEALGKEHVRAILLPSPYSSAHSVADAEELSRRLGNPHDIVPIGEVYESLLNTLKPIFADSPFGLAEENLQSRARGNLLMGIANKFGYILLNTSNKSELATGYGTLYGDMAGGLSVLGDVYKLQVYALARHINRDKEIIPASILSKAPSAELRPNQKDTDSLPEYDILDKVLYQYIEKRKGPKEIIAMGIDEALVRRVLKMVNTNEYKRNQFCPIIRVSGKAFGVGRRMPIVGKYLS